MTPRSSWWQSTAERGGGLVCWLETLRVLIAAPPMPNVVFTANSGHELGHLGLDDFLARRPGWERSPAEGGALWVHYGANIGAIGGELSILSADPDLAARMAAELTRAGHPPARVAPPSLVPSGETRDIHRAGGRYLDSGRQQSLVSPARGSLAGGGRSRRDRAHRRRRLPP